MGGRLSTPRGPAGTTESSKIPSTSFASPRRRFQTRQLFAPLAAVTLGAIFYVYSRTSIQAAKDSAKRHREADGGTISWRNEGMRRHGTLAKPEERGLFQQIFGGKEDEVSKERREKEAKRLERMARDRYGNNPIEDGIRRARARSAGIEKGAEGEE